MEVDYYNYYSTTSTTTTTGKPRSQASLPARSGAWTASLLAPALALLVLLLLLRLANIQCCPNNIEQLPKSCAVQTTLNRSL